MKLLSLGERKKEKELKKYIVDNKESLYRFAYSYAKKQDDALDIVHDSICKSLTKIDTLKDINNIKPWIYKIISNCAIDYIRKNKKYVINNDLDLDSSISYDIYENIDLQKALDELPEKYKTIVILRYFEDMKISDNLDEVVNDALNNKSIKIKRKTINRWSSVAASVCVVVGAINLSPAFANTLEEIPVIGNVIKIINFRNYRIDENGFYVSIDIPKIEGLKNKDLEYRLNKDFEEEGKKLYQEYLKEMETLKSEGIEGRDLVKSWYEVKTDNDEILSLVIFNYYAQGSSNTTRKFYNINKKDQTVLTLEGMFAGTDYVNIISENIKEQMRERMKENPDEHYWLDEEMEGFNFEKINKDQGFYINDNNELVICFDKYEVGPGSTGLAEFVIPKEITSKLMK